MTPLSENQRDLHAYTRARHLHRQRMGALRRVDNPPPEPDATPELAAAWRSLQLHWLATVPGYRDEIRRRVDEAARRVERKTARIERSHRDVDYLGREVEGCG